MILETIALLLEDEIPGLNPKIWKKNGKIYPKVRNHLLKILDDFIAGLDESPEITDIVLAGSNCSFNWSSTSDIDIHLVVDVEGMKDPLAFYDYLTDKGALWNEHHDIRIKGLPVEIYILKSAESTVSNGIFSLRENKWLKKPEPLGTPPKSDSVTRKADEFKWRIDKILDILKEKEYTKAANRAHKLRERIRLFRQSGLSKKGELSVENLAFKELRNSGYIDKLKTADREAYDKMMSLEEALSLGETATKISYPNVTCGTHIPAPGYVVCKHVVNGAPVKHEVPPTPSDLGEITCGRQGHTISDMVLTCYHCAVEQYLRKRQ